MALPRRRITNTTPVLPEDILPPLKKKRNKPPQDRGLAGDEVLAELAREYLVWQRKSWPELVAKGFLPETTDSLIAAMVENFKARHRSGVVDQSAWAGFSETGLTLFGNYNRYSSDNSSKNSNVDQLVKVLQAAAAKKHFIPWEFVFGDYAVSGMDASRIGYTSYKSVLTNRCIPIQGTYIDDFSRASRDEIEWWRLAKLSRVLKKSMFGASDGFDLSHESWDIQVTIFGLVSRLYIKSARQKSKRGVEGAARRFKTVGRLPFGFTRCVLRDAKGEVIVDSDGEPVYGITHFAEYIAIRREICEMYALQNLSVRKIQKLLNSRNAAGWNRWSDMGIVRILRSAANLGIFIFNRFRKEFVLDDNGDEKLNKNGRPLRVLVENPRSEWIVMYVPDQAAISLDLWRLIRRRLAVNYRPRKGSGPTASRNEISATTLFSGTLFCEDCKRELTLSRGTGQGSGCMYCANGTAGLSGCSLVTHKSTRIIEKCLLDYLIHHVLTEAAVCHVVEKSNEWVKELKASPPEAAKSIKDEIRRLQHKIKRLVKLAEDESEDTTNGSDLAAEEFRKRVRELRQQVTKKTQRLREIEPVDPVSVMPLDKARLLSYLADARAMMNQEIPKAAAVIRGLTGRIHIRQLKDPARKRGATWIASFQPNLVNLLLQVTAGRDIPETITLGLQNTSIWNVSQAVEVLIAFRPRYEQVAQCVLEMRQKGASGTVIQQTLGITTQQYQDALSFAETGQRPKPRKLAKPGRRLGGKRSYRYKEIAQEVIKLRDTDGLSFPAIGRRLDVSERTAVRAYDFGHPEIVQLALDSGKPINRRSARDIERHRKIRGLVAKGKTTKQILALAQCSEGLVDKIRGQIKREGGQ